MQNDDFQSMIERYKRELMEYEKKRPASPVISDIKADTQDIGTKTDGTDEAATEKQIVCDSCERRKKQNFPTDTALQNTADKAPYNINKYNNNSKPSAASDEQEDKFNSQGSKFPPYQVEGRSFGSYDELIAGNTKTGTLRVQVFVGDRLLPVGSARVLVMKKLGGSDYVFYDEYSDASGIVSGLVLPCPDKDLADYPTGAKPYETYSLWIEHPGFYSSFYTEVLIFDGIETTQNAALIPDAGGDGEEIIKIYTKNGVTDFETERDEAVWQRL